MGRPNRSAERRRELLPVVAGAFADLGYRRTTTAELAQRCGVQETVLYRLWPDKRAMFTAAIEFVAEHSKVMWQRELEQRGSAGTTAEAVLDYESDHLGEHGLYRILFAGLSESDDPEIKKALRAAYRSFHRFILSLVEDHRGSRSKAAASDAGIVAWAMIGLGTAVSVGRELDLMTAKARRELLSAVGRRLLEP